jgi:phosphohistidine phosphatase
VTLAPDAFADAGEDAVKLVLVQHGEALPKDEDPDRPLTDRGRQDVSALSTFLSQAEELPALVLHSGKARARQSAEVLSVGSAPQVRDGLAPNDDTAAFAGELAAWREDAMVVGHQPFLGKLASRLLTGNETAVALAFEPASAVCLERDGEGRWRVAWMVRPELLRAT